MMLEGWRWYGPDDPVSLDDVRQAGATDIVSALHQVPIGEAWTRKAVEERKNFIEHGQPGRSQLTWSVVESIPIPDDVKRLGGKATASIEAWIASLEAVAAAGIKIICYNFMPVVDWCRTDLEWELPNGAPRHALRPGPLCRVRAAYPEASRRRAGLSPSSRRAPKSMFDKMSQADIDYLIMVIASALPGSTTEPMTIPQFRDRLETYRDITPKILRQHLAEFLGRVTPVAEQLGVPLTLHPDDPPRPLFGLPRIASTADDYQALFDAVPSKANGICLCTGSLGVRAGNDLPAMAERFGPRIAFAHLRATKREADGLSFHESDHLDGDVDMVAVLKALLKENARRSPDNEIVFRPDHGHRMLDDLAATKRTNPGYTAIGRLRGLAELRGAIRAIEHR